MTEDGKFSSSVLRHSIPFHAEFVTAYPVTARSVLCDEAAKRPQCFERLLRSARNDKGLSGNPDSIYARNFSANFGITWYRSPTMP